MKRLFYFAISAMIVLVSCHREINLSPEIDFNGMAYIKIIAENDFDSNLVDLTYCNYFPIQSCLTKRLTITKGGDYKTSFKITKPEMVYFEIKDSTLVTYMLPNDTLIIKIGIDQSNNKSESIYIHVNDPVFDFMQNEKKEFGCHIFQSQTAIEAFNKWPNSQKELEESIGVIDKAIQARLEFLENNKQNLPRWFVNIYKQDIIYYSADMKFFQYFWLNNRNLEGSPPPIGVEIYNPEGILSSSYWRFISDYFLLSDTVNNQLEGPTRMIALYNKAIERINAHLKGDILKCFRAYLLYDLYYGCNSRKELELVDSFMITNNFKLNAPEKSFIEQRKSESLGRIENLEDRARLKPGDKAPYFYLKDSSMVFHEISEYLGKVIYLHFWATWCGPCLAEIPSVNKLAISFTNEPLVIINICLDDNYDKWKSIVDSMKLEGANLICSGNWGSDIQEKYSISQIPHYAIVDGNGLIISNNCERPDNASEILLDLIKEK